LPVPAARPPDVVVNPQGEREAVLVLSKPET